MNAPAPEQRTYARLTGVLILFHLVLEGSGDAVTIIARGGEIFSQIAGYAAENPVLWRLALLNVGLSWISIGVMAFALYVVLEPVDRRLAQLALFLRLGASFVGAASLMFRVAQARLYQVSEPDGPFTTDQLRALVAVTQRGAHAGITIAWIFLGAAWMLVHLLLLRSRYVPGAVAALGVVGAVLLMAASGVMFVYPELTNELKPFALPGLLAEIATAFWLLFRGLPLRETAEARN